MNQLYESVKKKQKKKLVLEFLSFTKSAAREQSTQLF